MRQPVIRLRDEQVAELTRGQNLPLDPIAEAHLHVIFDAVARVWSELRRDQGHTVGHGSEAEINAMMEARLNALWKVDPLWSQLVSTVARGKESVSFDGSRLETRPDLSIFLTGKHPSFPIVVECKLIDHGAGKGVDLYCKNGIARFVTGQYAWANREAIMMAYIRDGSSIDLHLTPFLAGAAGSPPDPWHTARTPSSSATSPTPVAASAHERAFLYPLAGGGCAPGNIALWHLWLEAAPSIPVTAS